MKRTAIIAGILGLGLLAASWTNSESQAPSSDAKIALPSAKLVFNENGEAALPRGYRTWVHTYTAWEPITESLLDEKTTQTPEFHNVYVEPNAYRNYMLTGKWPEGTLIVKEFSFTSTDKANCDGPPAYLCNAWFGKVIFQHGYTGIALMLKDTKRYPAEAGGWAYFSYGHQQPPYKASSAPHDRARCAQCHIDRAGPALDYVLSTNQPGFSRQGDDAANNLAAAFPD
ncbi:hypothetical protein B6S44_21545 [Bosea sp. Tri-44]|uniref:cytochrome P460 family protein n=1 Tax=Bosea sp. Tri-44 TaxID=1972137 RepID=UPI00100EDFA8|nr:cytochrome P460 family protein [Bosea sp. Tri-44]RXT51192.1 hypothetical protein B6S44_21545 [Bosea sp. Tri-44]